MAPLQDVPLDDLHRALDAVNEKRPTQRLMVAILYKNGPSVPMIADWFDLRPATVYAWFDRIERDPLPDAVYDDPRPGRPAKLTAGQLERLGEALRRPPERTEEDVGGSAWNPETVQRYVSEAFGVQYSRRQARRLLDRYAPDGRSGN
ncbi:MAG: transposase [Halanaeroarchaeum sp.]